MRKKLIILGTSGLAREMGMLAEQINAVQHCWEIEGFIGEPGCIVGMDLGIGPILGDDAWLLGQDLVADLVMGIGYPKIRHRVASLYLNTPERFTFPNLIHPRATLDFRRVQLGRGNTITAGCVFTCDIVVDDFNLFNLNTTVGHDIEIGSSNVINPGCNISGGVHIKDRILIGTGAQILERIVIESGVTIGAGAVVTKNIGPDQTVVGVPAKPLIK